MTCDTWQVVSKCIIYPPRKYKTLLLVSKLSIVSKSTQFLLKYDLHCNLPNFRNVSNTSDSNPSDLKDYLGPGSWIFTDSAPLGPVGLVVNISVGVCVCLTSILNVFFEAFYWPSDNMISSRPLIGQPSSPAPTPGAPPHEKNMFIYQKYFMVFVILSAPVKRVCVSRMRD